MPCQVSLQHTVPLISETETLLISLTPDGSTKVAVNPIFPDTKLLTLADLTTPSNNSQETSPFEITTTTMPSTIDDEQPDYSTSENFIPANTEIDAPEQHHSNVNEIVTITNILPTPDISHLNPLEEAVDPSTLDYETLKETQMPNLI